jgi:hypothetical protein
VREVGIGSVPKQTWPERVGGGWAVVVHGRGSGLAWGTREVQGGYYARLLGRGDREGVGSSR